MEGGQVLVPHGSGLTVAEQVLLGQKVVVVCWEYVTISSNIYRSKLKYLAFL